MYEKDSQMPPKEIDSLVWAYEKKIDMCRAFQLGKDLLKRQYAQT